MASRVQPVSHAVSGLHQAALRAAVGRHGVPDSPQGAAALQPAAARQDDRRLRRRRADELQPLHHEPDDGACARHGESDLHHPVRRLRHLPLPLLAARQARGNRHLARAGARSAPPRDAARVGGRDTGAHRMTAGYSLIFTGVLLNALGQLLLKAGTNDIGRFDFLPGNLLPVAARFAFEPHILAGVACYAVSLVVWIMGLSRIEVSVAYPLLSLGYVINAAAAWYLFGESLSLMRIAGIGFIVLGVCCIARS